MSSPTFKTQNSNLFYLEVRKNGYSSLANSVIRHSLCRSWFNSQAAATNTMFDCHPSTHLGKGPAPLI